MIVLSENFIMVLFLFLHSDDCVCIQLLHLLSDQSVISKVIHEHGTWLLFPFSLCNQYVSEECQ